MASAVLFDIDGTLVDHEAACRAAVLAWTKARSARAARPDADMTAEWLRLEELHFGGYLAREITFEEQRRRRLRDYLSFLGEAPQLDGALDGLFQDYLRHYEASWTAYADAGPALAELKKRGLTLGVLTNGQEAQQRAKLDAVGLLDNFSHVIASSTLSASKPAVAAFHEACQRLGRDPQDVLYVGDNLRTDALAATAAGLAGVWLDRLQQAAPEPARSIGSLAEIIEIIDHR